LTALSISERTSMQAPQDGECWSIGKVYRTLDQVMRSLARSG